MRYLKQCLSTIFCLNLNLCHIPAMVSSVPQSQPLPSPLSHFSSLLETPTCVSCLGPSVFHPQPRKLAYSHNMGQKELITCNTGKEETPGLCRVHPHTDRQRFLGKGKILSSYLFVKRFFIVSY